MAMTRERLEKHTTRRNASLELVALKGALKRFVHENVWVKKRKKKKKNVFETVGLFFSSFFKNICFVIFFGLIFPSFFQLRHIS